jgi:acetylornithine deacetylase
VLLGHTDCVPFDPDWKEALLGEQRNGQIVGRGSADTKGFLACAVTAARRTAADRLPLTLLFTADEEIGCLGAKQALAEGKLKPRHAIVGEPTGLTPVRAHKGYCAVEVAVTGTEGHSAYPGVGASAIHAVGRLFADLEAIGAELRGLPDAVFDPPFTTWNVGLLRGGKARNIIAGECRFTYEWRPLPGQEARLALSRLEAACARLVAEGQGRLGVSISPMEHDHAVITPADAAIVKFLEQASGHAATTVPFGTELPEMAAMGADGVVFGPGDIRLAHRTGERVEVAELTACAAILEQAIRHFA